MACLEFITVIGVYGHSISLYFPVARNLDIIPGVSVHGRIGDIGRKIFVTVCKEELPRCRSIIDNNCFSQTFRSMRLSGCRTS